MTTIRKRYLISFLYEHRGQTSLWDGARFDVQEDPPDDQWRATSVYVGEHTERLEWIYVQIEKSVSSEDDLSAWRDEAIDEAQELADAELQRRHDGASPM
ncbi:MAG: hypothetical protein ACLQIB_58975 [Isosphaeraceae bacterium]